MSTFDQTPKASGAYEFGLNTAKAAGKIPSQTLTGALSRHAIAMEEVSPGVWEQAPPLVQFFQPTYLDGNWNPEPNANEGDETYPTSTFVKGGRTTKPNSGEPVITPKMRSAKFNPTLFDELLKYKPGK